MKRFLADITAAHTTTAVAATAARLPQIQSRLVDAGLAGVQQGRVMTWLIDALTCRLIALAETELGPPPGPYAWLACGSQGRQEQTFHTDQDNALIFTDGLSDDADRWFARLGARVTEGLSACGISHCAGGVGPHNGEWRRTVTGWRHAFMDIIRHPETRSVMLASHYFDLRCVHGDAQLLEQVRQDALAEARANRLFLARVKQNALRSRAGIGAFGRFHLQRRGPARGTLDLKQRGLLPIAQLALAHGLEAGTTALSTPDRIQAARDAGVVSTASARDLSTAFAAITDLRSRVLRAQLRSGEPPANTVDLKHLGGLERSHLRASLGVIRRAQTALEQGV
ncbi:DUF294 nucleotidyltransferase-like domain-containing protein [Aquisalimonas asiatica]|uniref:Putative nucleotidyltransferase substrate binding domain-containing protein n=1 Tax=Aquisalimonas asiatica TaxID=406100 RepID=A0A1H8Q3L1_9GAMM|nr:DUF294 nucleotidyltransferase-like domain-containing protein [Aquisalimonas asiatica]SEO48835.1 Putative nucleotidyltransferase substrate binding domain-containing protein [Aquisalimonas asiatica]